MSATFRKFLVFEMTTGQPGAFQFMNRARRILRAAESGIGIDNRRNFHRLRDESGQHRDFGQRQQSDIRQARGAIRQSRAADINRIKSGTLHLPRHRRVRHARHRHAIFRDQLA